MAKFDSSRIKRTDRIQKLIDDLYADMPEVESARAILITEAYKATENEPLIIRRAKAFQHILENIPIVIRPNELIVGSTTLKPHSCQTYPEFSYEWLEAEFETAETREADPFRVPKKAADEIREANKYWKGKTNFDLATSYMEPETLKAIEHNIFTTGNYYYNGVGHVNVQYDKVINEGLEGVMAKAAAELSSMEVSDGNYCEKSRLLQAIILSCHAVIGYAQRYANLADEMAAKESNPVRKEELKQIAVNCRQVPGKPAKTFYQAVQTVWFLQQLLQLESSGHSISPGRFDQYMYPLYKKGIEEGTLTREQAQEYIDCFWIKLNDLNKIRDGESAKGFAGYGLFQNLIAGGQDTEGRDATNDLSFMCIEASFHVPLPQPSLSVRVWNGSPREFLIRAAELTKTGIGLPAYYNDEGIIPMLMSQGLTLEEARNYCIIGCVEPQIGGKTWGWHDAAFYNMCRPLEFVFSSGMDNGEQLGPKTQDVLTMQTFEEFEKAYQEQTEYFIKLLVNSDNAIDRAHAERVPLPFLAGLVDDCIKTGKTCEQGGAVYNFTGPQGFGIANVADGMLAIKKLVFEQKKVSMSELKDALFFNFGDCTPDVVKNNIAGTVTRQMIANGQKIAPSEVEKAVQAVIAAGTTKEKVKRYEEILSLIDDVDSYGNDIEEADMMARDMAYTYTKPLRQYKNPRGGKYQAGLYPVSANVPLGVTTGATPDGRRAGRPIADGIGPMQGRDVSGPTATANSVAMLDQSIVGNGTLLNQKFHPSALSGDDGLNNFVDLIRTYFDMKGLHMQFNVISRETLLDAQKHPENYKYLVVRVAGYSALFTGLSKSLQDDIIARTEQGF